MATDVRRLERNHTQTLGEEKCTGTAVVEEEEVLACCRASPLLLLLVQGDARWVPYLGEEDGRQAGLAAHTQRRRAG
jgi:hypothetical protein